MQTLVVNDTVTFMGTLRWHKSLIPHNASHLDKTWSRNRKKCKKWKTRVLFDKICISHRCQVYMNASSRSEITNPRYDRRETMAPMRSSDMCGNTDSLFSEIFSEGRRWYDVQSTSSFLLSDLLTSFPWTSRSHSVCASGSVRAVLSQLIAILSAIITKDGIAKTAVYWTVKKACPLRTSAQSDFVGWVLQYSLACECAYAFTHFLPSWSRPVVIAPVAIIMDLGNASATGIRKRRSGTSEKSSSSEQLSSTTARSETDNDNYAFSSGARIRGRRSALKPGSDHSSASSFFLLLCVISSSLLYIAAYQFRRHRISTLSTFDDASLSDANSAKFSSANAMDHVRALGARMRWVGTHSLEESMSYIEKYLRDSIHTANKSGMSLHVEPFHSGPGSYGFSISNIDLPLSYNNLSSVTALLTPSDYNQRTTATVRDTLLINAHVDSAVGAPGASDNVGGAAIALEVFRSIISSPGALKRPLLFLFNGAEESGLAGAHSFVMQKRDTYLKNVVAYINTESIGSGDSYYLFRYGPEHAWLAHAFSKSVSMPSTSSSANDIFESKVRFSFTSFSWCSVQRYH